MKKTLTQILNDVDAFNADNFRAGKNFVLVPPVSTAEMVDRGLVENGIGFQIAEAFDFDSSEFKQLRSMLTQALSRPDAGAEYYADCVVIGDLICQALQNHADNTIRALIADRRRYLRAV